MSTREVAGYVLERPLGHGGMADVWLGRHRISGGHAAVKLLREKRDGRARDLFLNEQRALVRLSHPNIVPLFDCGEDFIVTAFVEGHDLGHYMRAPMSARQALTIATAIGSALAAAHARAVLHLDVKPGNILIDARGTPFLADFGIAWLEDDPDGARRRYHAGTNGFMAPEHAAGRPSAASDQYALARTLLAMLTEGSVRTSTDSALRKLPHPLAEALEAPLRRALAEDPAARHASMAAFADVLRSAEVTESLGPPRRARLRIDARPFQWAEHPEDVESHGDALMSARYSLRLLEIRDARITDRAATFRGVHGYRDFGWSVYARNERLGDVHRADAYARATVLVVLLHGAFTSRAIWHDMAVGIARDNPAAIVLVPDLIGFGSSILADDAPRGACTPQGMMRAVRDWIGTLGLENVPCVLVGHSFSATALLCARRADLGPLLHRLCLSPILPFANRRERLKAHALGVFARMAATLPQPVQRAVTQRMFARDPALTRVLPAARSAMANAAMTLGARRLGHLMTEIARLRPAPAAELDDCTVVTVPDDPLVPDHLVADTVAAAGIGSDHCYRLAYGGHFPQLADAERPEWIARNVHEFVNLIDALLERARNTGGSSDQRSPDDVPTVFEP